MGLRPFFLPNFPGATFIPDSRVPKISIVLSYALSFYSLKNPINRLRLHQFLGTKTTEANHSLKTDANKAY